ncbi:MAG: glycosyltransferase [Candidatus Woesearchaeota archaeon]|jgi:glycosyltransferase involved in cell wall biosynthesis|nr:glycosyltransferase [Candidatus Woesearchaeota archaeon]MDP7324167.1 glycosyltransferase [Candidatus Woesearchaeota archaeon]MDP7458289.1 glycosyltransferase [Candidatus Woesearchaeota archaeon]|tara:strand:- start:90 stop:1118 length:1029 start_codon:yes stop_codon:yes gene_type:complete
MKIALMSKFPPEECGIGIYCSNLYEKLKKKADVITIGTLKSKADYQLNFHDFTLKEQVKKIIEKEQVDLLHCQYIPPYYGTKFLNQNFVRLLSLDIPTVVTFHEVQYDKKGIKNKILRIIERQILKKANKVLVHSPLTKKYLTEKGFTNVEHMFMGVHLLDYNPKNNKFLLSFGIVSIEKGHPYLLEAMKSLPDHSLVIAGRPVEKTYGDELNTKIKELDLKNVITDFGWISEEAKDIYYRKASMLVLPYLWGPYTSAVIHDAISYTMPVVVTKVGAVWEIPETYKLGKVIKPENAEEIVKGIKDIQNNFSFYKDNIKNYRKLANWESVASATLKIYEQLLK